MKESVNLISNLLTDISIMCVFLYSVVYLLGRYEYTSRLQISVVSLIIFLIINQITKTKKQ
jgi:hypothetical protein